MLAAPEMIERLARASGLTWAEIARRLEVDWDTVRNWRRGHNLPTRRKAERLVAVIGGGAELLAAIDRDRETMAQLRREARAATAPVYTTPRTLIMDDDRDGAA